VVSTSIQESAGGGICDRKGAYGGGALVVLDEEVVPADERAPGADEVAPEYDNDEGELEGPTRSELLRRLLGTFLLVRLGGSTGGKSLGFVILDMGGGPGELIVSALFAVDCGGVMLYTRPIFGGGLGGGRIVGGSGGGYAPAEELEGRRRRNAVPCAVASARGCNESSFGKDGGGRVCEALEGREWKA
jgi:hypothetical protein